MFFFIFGIEDRQKDIRDFPNVICPDCGRYSSATFFEHHTYLHIFFIPTFRWNRRYFLKLRCCGTVYETDAAYAKELKTADTIDFSRFTKISDGDSRFYDMFATCAHCGKSYDGSFSYCPYCGAKK